MNMLKDSNFWGYLILFVMWGVIGIYLFLPKAVKQEEMKMVVYPEIVAGWDELEGWKMELNEVSDLFKNACDYFYVVNDHSYQGAITKLKVKDYIVMKMKKGIVVYLKTGK